MIRGLSSRRLAVCTTLILALTCLGGWDFAGVDAPPDADVLTGIWDVTLSRPNPGTADHAEYRGQIALVPATDLQGLTWTSLGTPTHLGVYSLDLRPLGIHHVQQSRITIVGAKLVGRSVTIVINPGTDHGTLVMRGSLDGDRMNGVVGHRLCRRCGRYVHDA